MLRIIGGKYRHLIIDAPDTFSTRPTSDRVREALMSALSNEIEDKVILDLFSGSGALAIEALSRGAKYAYLCDNASIAIKTINANIKKLGITNAKVIFNDYKKSLEYFKLNNIKFDIVFLDPPYIKKEVYQDVLNYLLENDLLNDNAVLVEESDIELKNDIGISRNYKYGKIHIRITRSLKK